MSSNTPVPPPPPTPDATPAAPAPVPDEMELKKAFHAFKKRLKSLQLETDSKLGRQHVTGRKETITAIQPPLGHGKEVWQHLATKGYLRYDGRGFYLLVKNDW